VKHLQGTNLRLSLDLTLKHSTTLERSARDIHSSLLRTLINYRRKKFLTLGPGFLKLELCSEVKIKTLCCMDQK
jgi:hypothetical protein